MAKVNQNNLYAIYWPRNKKNYYTGESCTCCPGSLQESLERILCTSHNAPEGVNICDQRVASFLAYMAGQYAKPFNLEKKVARLHDDAGGLKIYLYEEDRALVWALTNAWRQYTDELIVCSVVIAS